jgi:hypothetical protein
VAGLLLALVLGLIAIGIRQTFTSRVSGGNDLYPRWAAGCAWLTQGVNPYSAEATLDVQRGIYGRPALPSEDKAAFAYPIYVVLVTWPLCLTANFASVHAVAMTALILCLILSAILARRVVGWRPRGWIWCLVWIAVMYPNARMVLLGQLAGVVSVLLIGALAAIRYGRDDVAGAALALATIKPQMAILIVPWLLFWGVFQGRLRLLYSFLITLALLVALPMIWLPTWPAGWLEQLRAYPSYTDFGSVAWILTTHFLRTPPAAEGLLTLGLVMWLGIEAWKGRRQAFEPMLWGASLSLVLTHFVAPRTATTHFSALLVPLFLLFRVGQSGNERRGAWFIAGLMPLIAVASWALFLLTVRGRFESALNYIPIPLALLVSLVLVRTRWRAVVGETP